LTSAAFKAVGMTITTTANATTTVSFDVVDAAGNASACTPLRYAHDSIAPNTRIVGRVPARTTGRRLVVRFSAAGAPTRFQCKLDAGRWTACASPLRVPMLRRGRHVLLVRAIDAAGNVDPTPAVARWTAR
jgi:hypothetical protein